MKRTVLSFLVLISIFNTICVKSEEHAKEALWKGNGRIAISSDGNEHDNDDWAATPLSLALLAAKGLQDKMVLYTYSDHIWGSNQEVVNLWGRSSYEEMRISALGAKQHFGYNNSKFVCAVDNPQIAYNSLRDEINKSSADNPLFIVAAGPMQVVGEALRLAEKDKRRYVTVISHSDWNNNHAAEPYILSGWDNHFGWTFEFMKKTFSKEENGRVKFVQILDQNGGSDYKGLYCESENYDWIKTSEARNNPVYKPGSWDWLYSRLESCMKTKNGKICTSREEGKYFDPSDAGLIIFLLTGVEKTNPDMVREIMELK